VRLQDCDMRFFLDIERLELGKDIRRARKLSYVQQDQRILAAVREYENGNIDLHWFLRRSAHIAGSVTRFMNLYIDEAEDEPQNQVLRPLDDDGEDLAAGPHVAAAVELPAVAAVEHLAVAAEPLPAAPAVEATAHNAVEQVAPTGENQLAPAGEPLVLNEEGLEPHAGAPPVVGAAEAHAPGPAVVHPGNNILAAGPIAGHPNLVRSVYTYNF
jgi:hypothetical protein